MATLHPAWSDRVLTIAMLKGGYLSYQLTDGETTLFNGKAHVIPGTKFAKIPFGSIVRDFVSAKINLILEDSVQDEVTYSRVITVKSGGATIAEYLVYNDYSYENVEMSISKPLILSRPLSNVVDPRQYLFCTVANLKGEASAVAIKQGAKVYASANVVNCCTFTIPLSAEELLGKRMTTSGVYKTMIYEVRETNADYCLYYLNAYGGYDHLLIRGNSLMSESYTRTEVRKNELNTTLKHNRDIIATDISRKWQLHTDYLSDEQWALTHHLLGSPHIFLHDLNTGKVTPVIITAHQADWKTYRNQGNRKSNLTIEVEEARTRMRK